MAACTSRAAEATSRSRSNCSVMLVEPSALRGHLGEAGDAAEAALEGVGHRRGHRVGAGAAACDTEMVGKSTLGSGAMACVKPASPRADGAESSEVRSVAG